MSNTPNFASLLDEAPDHVERPKPVPEGTYLGIVGQWTAGKSSKKQTPLVDFPIRIVSPQDDVDLEALDEMGGIEGKVMKATFYTTEDAIFMLDQFHENCGIDLNTPMSRRQRNDEVLNAQVLVFVKHRMNEDGSQVFAEIRSTAPVGD